MSLKKKRQQELLELKEKRKEEVVQAAIAVFKEKSIDAAKMTDIALKAEVGVASVYRYFKTKMELVIEVAIWLWREEIRPLYGQFNEDVYRLKTGLQQVEMVLQVFVHLFEVYPDFLSILEQFDNYVVNEKIPLEQLALYEQNIIDLKKITLAAVEKGKGDGTIGSQVDGEVFYITITHSLMSLAQKLVLRGSVLKSDGDVEGKVQLDLLIQMALKYLA